MNDENEKTWNLKDIIIWSKQKNIPWYHKGIFKNHFEFVLFLTKNDNYKFNIDRIREIADLKKWWISYPERYNPNGKVPTNVWEINSPIRGWGNGCQKHFCPFPFQLIERIISLSTDEGDLILDPFAGSGSVMAIAKQMGRNSIGFDVNENYRKKFKQEVLPGAERYWERRKIDLLKVGKNIDRFKKANYNLRKLKFCGNIILNLMSNEMPLEKYRFLCIGKKNNSEIKIIMLYKGKKPNMNFLQLCENDFEEISRVYKVKADIESMNIRELANLDINTNYFEYDPLKTNKYINKITSQEFNFKKLNRNKIYSNIELNITKMNDLFK